MIYILEKILLGIDIAEGFVIRVKELKSGKKLKSYFLVSRVYSNSQKLEDFYPQTTSNGIHLIDAEEKSINL